MKARWVGTWIVLAACGPEYPPIDVGDDPIDLAEVKEGLVVLPPATTFEKNIVVELVPMVEDSRVYYTLDGTQPIPSDSKVYEGPLEFESTTLISAMAVRPDGMWTQVVSSLYQHQPAVEPAEKEPRSLRLSRDQLVFVARTHNQDLVRSLEIVSAGLEPIQIVGVELNQTLEEDGRAAFSLLDDLQNTILQPGERRELRVRFVVTSRTFRSGRLLIRSDASAGVSRELEVELHGRLFP